MLGEGRLKGSVKLIREKQLEEDGAKFAVKYQRTYSYKSKNLLEEQVRYDDVGKLLRRDLCSYDPQDRLTHREVFRGTHKALEFTYTYDTSGKLLSRLHKRYLQEENEDYLTPEIDTVQYEWGRRPSSRGNAVVMLTPRSRDNHFVRVVEVYNPDGTQVFSVHSYFLVEPKDDPDIVFNHQGRVQELLGIDRDQGVVHKYLLDYDARGRVSKFLVQDEAGLLFRQETFVYDIHGGLISKRIEATHQKYPQAGLLNQMYVYDEYGNELEQTLMDSGGQLLEHTRHTYEYDKQGNWIRCTRLESRGVRIPLRVVSIVERELLYYE